MVAGRRRRRSTEVLFDHRREQCLQLVVATVSDAHMDTAADPSEGVQENRIKVGATTALCGRPHSPATDRNRADKSTNGRGASERNHVRHLSELFPRQPDYGRIAFSRGEVFYFRLLVNVGQPIFLVVPSRTAQNSYPTYQIAIAHTEPRAIGSRARLP